MGYTIADHAQILIFAEAVFNFHALALEIEDQSIKPKRPFNFHSIKPKRRWRSNRETKGAACNSVGWPGQHHTINFKLD